MGHMRIAPGKVVNGRVELDAELPEGTSVTVLALEGDETFEADAETERMLLQAIAQCEKGQTTPMTRLPAIAASIALPPSRSAEAPASEAR